jgi:hypothetical protein
MPDIFTHSNGDLISDGGELLYGNAEADCCCVSPSDCSKCSDPIIDPTDPAFQLEIAVEWQGSILNEDCHDCVGLGIPSITSTCPSQGSTCCWTAFKSPSGECGEPYITEVVSQTCADGPGNCCLASISLLLCVLEDGDSLVDQLGVTLLPGQIVWGAWLNIGTICPGQVPPPVSVVWRSDIRTKPEACANLPDIHLDTLVQNDGLFCDFTNLYPMIYSNSNPYFCDVVP